MSLIQSTWHKHQIEEILILAHGFREVRSCSIGFRLLRKNLMMVEACGQEELVNSRQSRSKEKGTQEDARTK